ncbi:MAG: hypothetical protein ABI199_06625 [Bacteroidia bacterium]
MKNCGRYLYIMPIVGAVVGCVMLFLYPHFRIEKAILAIAATVIPYCVASACQKLCGSSCGCNSNCNCSCCNNKTEAK